MPTFAGLLDLSADERVKLGGWLDHECVEHKKLSATAVRYSDKKLDAALKIKTELRTTLRIAITKAGPGITAMNWPAIAKLCPRKGTVTDPDFQDFHDDTVMTPRLPKLPSLAPGKEGVSGSSDCGASSSASELSDSSAGAPIDEIAWLKASCHDGCLHLACSAPNEGALTRWPTACGRLLLKPSSGMGLSNSPTDAQWSPRCWGKLRYEHRQWWTRRAEGKEQPIITGPA